MTAHYLTKRTFFVKKGMYILIHAASGGVGMYLTKMCKEVGAIVIGCVGYDEKIAVAKSNGCDYVINYLNEDFHKMVMDITKNKGVNAVYDSIGKNTFLKSIMCLSNYGIMVSYGTSSGPIPPFDINYLREKNIFLTSPSIFKYKENRYELIFSSSEIWTMLQKNIITDNINMKYKFEDIQTAHKDIENRATVGSNIIVL
jgi:NADPH2:quinone reductase